MASAAMSMIGARHLHSSDGGVYWPRKQWQRPTLSVAQVPLLLHRLTALPPRPHSLQAAAGRSGLQDESVALFSSRRSQALLMSPFVHVPPAPPSISQGLLARLTARRAARRGTKVVAQATATGAPPDVSFLFCNLNSSSCCASNAQALLCEMPNKHYK